MLWTPLKHANHKHVLFVGDHNNKANNRTPFENFTFAKPILEVQSVKPKIIGGGSNRLFKVESGGELVVKSLNLTGGVASGSGDDGLGSGILLMGPKFKFPKSSFVRTTSPKLTVSSFSTNLEKPTISAATTANNFLSMYYPCHV